MKAIMKRGHAAALVIFLLVAAVALFVLIAGMRNATGKASGVPPIPFKLQYYNVQQPVDYACTAGVGGYAVCPPGPRVRLVLSRQPIWSEKAS